VSALPPAKKMPVKSKKNFEKANIEYRIMNVECRMSKECILPVVSFLSNGLFYKKTERSDSTLRHSIFDILRFCGSLLMKSTKKKSSKKFQFFLGNTPRVRSEPVL